MPRCLSILTEVAVIVSLFTAGLQLRLPINRAEWGVALRLATVAMVLTVALITAIAFFVLGLPLGVAVILGAILAPTDPVLASDVQLKRATDTDQLRFVLTGEAGLNDGTAFPFVMLGLGLLGAHDIGAGGWRWWLVDVLWAVPAGLTIGAALGSIVGKIVLYLRQHHREAVGLDNFLAVGLIGLSYGTALYASSYGFLAVFAAGVALRRVERTRLLRRRTTPFARQQVAARPAIWRQIPKQRQPTWPRQCLISMFSWSDSRKWAWSSS